MMEATRIEPAPWIKDFVLDMDELYTELTLKTSKNTLQGESGQILSSYKSIFVKSEPWNVSVRRSKGTNQSPNYFRKICPCLPYDQTVIGTVQKNSRGQKILFKGEPGMGKTTITKKIGWDWAQGNFETFQIVFFIILKLVQPADSIESIIIQQTPALEGMGVTEERLSAFLNVFGNRCFLILDGLDEHVERLNRDVMKIIRGQKLFRCNFMLTSRPHSTREIANYFQVLVSVEGFTENKAEKFALKVLKNKRMVKDVLDFNPTKDINNTLYKGNLYQCPILLSFLCLLVRENAISLSNQTITVGEIYAEMIKCLYQKYLIKFKPTEFVKSMKLIGSIAFRMLLSGKPYFPRNQVLEEVGSDAFDYGLLISYDDFRLIPDVFVDILITFAHRSIEEFLGAFFFVVSILSGQRIESLLGENCTKPVFMMNPLFLHFCLWLIGNKKEYMPIGEKNSAFKPLAEFCFKLVAKNVTYFPRIVHFYPAIDIVDSYRKDNKTLLPLFDKILVKISKHTRSIILSQSDPHDSVLKYLISKIRKVA